MGCLWAWYMICEDKDWTLTHTHTHTQTHIYIYILIYIWLYDTANILSQYTNRSSMNAKHTSRLVWYHSSNLYSISRPYTTPSPVQAIYHILFHIPLYQVIGANLNQCNFQIMHGTLPTNDSRPLRQNVQWVSAQNTSQVTHQSVRGMLKKQREWCNRVWKNNNLFSETASHPFYIAPFLAFILLCYL